MSNVYVICTVSPLFSVTSDVSMTENKIPSVAQSLKSPSSVTSFWQIPIERIVSPLATLTEPAWKVKGPTCAVCDEIVTVVSSLQLFSVTPFPESNVAAVTVSETVIASSLTQIAPICVLSAALVESWNVCCKRKVSPVSTSLLWTCCVKTLFPFSSIFSIVANP